MKTFTMTFGLFLLILAFVSRIKLTLSQEVLEPDIIDAPFQLLYFQIPDGESFHPNLKYPPYHRCIMPERLHKKNTTGKKSENEKRKWRLYWSKEGWGSHYFQSGDSSVNWEYDKENGVRDKPYVLEAFVPVITCIFWILAIFLATLICYPIISMIIFRCLLVIWEIVSCRWIRRVSRTIIIKYARFRRNNTLRVFQDAGHRPPFYRYSLPFFCREDAREAIPKELDETDEEFWSSDDDLVILTNLKKSQGRNNKPTPEFTPEYPVQIDERYVLSDDTFSYLIRIKDHGMFAVWTDGLDDINLEAIDTTRHKQTTKFSLKKNT